MSVRSFFQRFTNYNRSLVISLLLLNLPACSSLGVEPWQRDVLSRADMQFEGNALSTTFSQQFYYSKEGSSGGQGFAGGGCGCN